MVCVFAVVFNCGCLKGEGGGAITMTLEEVISDYKKSLDSDTKTYYYWLDSLSDGDILIIEDTLSNVTYLDAKNMTLINFESSANISFGIEGDITDDFEKGDTVKLKTHIIAVSFVEEDRQTGEPWTIFLETFEEGWNMQNHTAVPFPKKCISHA